MYLSYDKDTGMGCIFCIFRYCIQDTPQPCLIIKFNYLSHMTSNRPGLLLLREGRPLCRHLLADVDESDVGRLLYHLHAPLVQEMHIAVSRLCVI